MPDIPASVWFPVVTLLLGFATKAVADYFAHNRLLTRERESRAAARQDAASERRANFQRQTLLELQDAVMGLMRANGRMHFEDSQAFQQTGHWGRKLLGDELSETHRMAIVTTRTFAVRVADETVRELASRLVSLSAELVCADSRESSERAFGGMTTTGSTLNERIGIVLRGLDEPPPSLNPT